MSLPPETNHLLQAYFAGDPSPDVIEAMETWLRADPANPRILAEYGLIDRLIACEQKTLDASAIFASLLEAEEAAEPIPFPKMSAHAATQDDTPDRDSISLKYACSVLGFAAMQAIKARAAYLATAAAILILGVALIQFMSRPTDQIADNASTLDDTPAADQKPIPPSIKQPVATLTNAHNAQWSTQAERASARGSNLSVGSNLTVGSPLHPNQRLTLTAGFAEITTNRGAIAILEAPATIELLDSDNALHLHTGKLVGICQTESSKGFVVKTDHADITDIGTQFGVHAHADGVQTTVFIGEVEIKTPAGQPEPVTTNQTATLNVQGNNRELIIQDQLAAEFDALRDQHALLTPTLVGTGQGLAIDEYDANWHITAVDGQALDTPLTLRVRNVTGDAPDALAPTKILMHNPAHGKRDTTYRIETTARLPVSFDPERIQLVMRFRVDNELLSLKVNGQAVQVPKQITDDYARDYVMVINTALKPGDNHLVFEVKNEGVNTPENPVGIQVAWQLQPVPTKQPGQTS